MLRTWVWYQQCSPNPTKTRGNWSQTPLKWSYYHLGPLILLASYCQTWLLVNWCQWPRILGVTSTIPPHQALLSISLPLQIPNTYFWLKYTLQKKKKKNNTIHNHLQFRFFLLANYNDNFLVTINIEG